MDLVTNPVSKRTRLQMSHSYHDYSQRSRVDAKNIPRKAKANRLSRRPDSSDSFKVVNVPKSEPENEQKSNGNPSAVQDSGFVEFLLVNQEGIVKKFYIDKMQLKNHQTNLVDGLDSKDAAAAAEVCKQHYRNISLEGGSQSGNTSRGMNDSASVQARVSSQLVSPVVNVQCISSDSDNENCTNKKGKEIENQGITSVLPICIVSDDDEQVNGECVKTKDPCVERGDASKGTTTCVPLKKRHKFDEQQLPGLHMISSLEHDAKSYLDTSEGDKLLVEMKSSLQAKGIQAKNPLGRVIKKEIMK